MRNLVIWGVNTNSSATDLQQFHPQSYTHAPRRDNDRAKSVMTNTQIHTQKQIKQLAKQRANICQKQNKKKIIRQPERTCVSTFHTSNGIHHRQLKRKIRNFKRTLRSAWRIKVGGGGAMWGVSDNANLQGRCLSRLPKKWSTELQ